MFQFLQGTGLLMWFARFCVCRLPYLSTKIINRKEERVLLLLIKFVSNIAVSVKICGAARQSTGSMGVTQEQSVVASLLSLYAQRTALTRTFWMSGLWKVGKVSCPGWK